eukprot:scaffold15534_cov57-Phaeocystis_antarctica.AAC.6
MVAVEAMPPLAAAPTTARDAFCVAAPAFAANSAVPAPVAALANQAAALAASTAAASTAAASTWLGSGLGLGLGLGLG